MIRSVPRRWLVLDIVGSVFGFLVTAPLAFIMGAGSLSAWLTPDWLAIAVSVVVSAALWGAAAISRLTPAIALAISWGACLLQMLTGLPPMASNVAVFVVLFATAAWGSRRLLWTGGASAVAGGVVAGLYIGVQQFGMTGSLLSEGVRVLLVAALMGSVAGLSLALSWGAGLLWRQVVRGREIRDAQLRAEATAAEEAERVRIARDMHDVVAHSLAVVIAQADGARYAAASDPKVAQEALGTIAQTARGALSDVRMLLTQLRHRQGDGPQPTLADLETLFAQVRRAGVEPRVTVDPTPPGEPPAAIQLAVYRILQEALTNALRHGTGGVDVRLSWWADAVDVTVSNAVSGDDRPSIGGHGVIGMRERAQLVGGTLQAGRDGDQFTVSARLPVGPSSSSGTGLSS
ncbi:sensor histidine kinase [Microbacterium bovistercoris]|uniref:histidine kinase n=1 Tax=Microbacterium bovistercoris TaxID=2293570 RepID=A0A371NRV4_9MICO|nr:histidine kinase [Microbacterium bovistercoris]REJ04911.1 sensor histidine kinase [Microbacterium bovistercoris]